MTTISERIQSALTGNAKASEIKAVLADARDEADRLASQRDTTRAKSLDPVASASEVKAARAALADIDFEAERLAVAAEKLGEALEAAQKREAEGDRRKAYKDAQAERDALAKELAEVYPEAAGKIADLLSRIAANNAVLEAVNHDLPAGASYIKDAEHIARGVMPNGMLDRDGVASVSHVPRLVSKVTLPHLDGLLAAQDHAGLWSKSRLETASHGTPNLRAVS